MHLFSDNGTDPPPSTEVLIEALATFLDRHHRDFQSEIREILAALSGEEDP